MFDQPQKIISFVGFLSQGKCWSGLLLNANALNLVGDLNKATILPIIAGAEVIGRIFRLKA
jgi:hypothetical protein